MQADKAVKVTLPFEINDKTVRVCPYPYSRHLQDAFPQCPFLFLRKCGVTWNPSKRLKRKLARWDLAQAATQPHSCVFYPKQVTCAMFLIICSTDKAEVSIKGTVQNDARYFMLSDGNGKTAKTQIIREGQRKLFFIYTAFIYLYCLFNLNAKY